MMMWWIVSAVTVLSMVGWGLAGVHYAMRRDAESRLLFARENLREVEEARRIKPVRVVVKRERMEVEELRKCFVSGPETPLWQGVEELINRIQDEVLDEVDDPQIRDEVKARAVDRRASLDELRRQMYAAHGAIKETNNKA